MFVTYEEHRQQYKNYMAVRIIFKIKQTCNFCIVASLLPRAKYNVTQVLQQREQQLLTATMKWTANNGIHIVANKREDSNQTSKKNFSTVNYSKMAHRTEKRFAPVNSANFFL
jgi:hypothetical protein